MLPGEVRAKKPSLILNLGINRLKVTYEPPTVAGQAGCLQGQDRLAVTHPSNSHTRCCLIWLSCDYRCTRYNAPLAAVFNIAFASTRPSQRGLINQSHPHVSHVGDPALYDLLAHPTEAVCEKQRRADGQCTASGHISVSAPGYLKQSQGVYTDHWAVTPH
ncbi:hypothetical protein J6590_105666 [Homalodisca vitripennis]|nr:hypothetical protein J6590_105666 [Homalodisca vitripennis]